MTFRESGSHLIKSSYINGGSWSFGIVLLLQILVSIGEPTSSFPKIISNNGNNGLLGEIFFLNLEDGFFGCQVNESLDVLKVFELSKLCDGSSQCFLGSDELHADLKCSDDCLEKTGRECVNGACLSSQCHCNDGYGGKGCEMPDQNECKFRPCDIFASCTNTLGSYFCTCLPGYEGDGHRCKDIDECKIPALRANCVENADCWNLPGHFACRCRTGFVGDGKILCQDVDECIQNPCGQGAICEEKTNGGFTCYCPSGYTGNPYGNSSGCIDIDECSEFSSIGACSGKAECLNLPGSFKCTCPVGFRDVHVANTSMQFLQCEQVDIKTKCSSNFDCINNGECRQGECACKAGFKGIGANCVDIDECDNHPCGVHAVCSNMPGGFKCSCEPPYPLGDPFFECKGSCEDVNCGVHGFCSTTPPRWVGVANPSELESYCVCQEGWTYNPTNVSAGCEDINECKLGGRGPCGMHSVCENLEGSFVCKCEEGFARESNLSGCKDVDECKQGNYECGLEAKCVNTIGGYECGCQNGTIPDPDSRIKCSRQTQCSIDDDCLGNAVCNSQNICACPSPNIGNDCRHPCESITCGPRAICSFNNDKATCVCPPGFHGVPSTSEGCIDTDECIFQPCGQGICRNQPGTYHCECPSGFQPTQQTEIGRNGTKNDCLPISPRYCGGESACSMGEECVTHISTKNVCVCPRGFRRDYALRKCVDLNECLELEFPCGTKATCKNLPGSYDCTCPKEFPVGNPFYQCTECVGRSCPCPYPFKLLNNSCVVETCSNENLCPDGAQCLSVTGGLSYCACQKGYVTKGNGECEDVNECLESGVCAPGANCVNRNGSFECLCPANYRGNPYKGGCFHPLLKCRSDDDCSQNEKCVDPGVCLCSAPFRKDESSEQCKAMCHPNEAATSETSCSSAKQTDSCSSKDNCGPNSNCVEGSCVCKLGYEGDPYSTTGCVDTNECSRDGVCGRNSICINLEGSFDCRCPADYPTGNPFLECLKLPVIENRLDCTKTNCRCNSTGINYCPEGFECHKGICMDRCDHLTCGANAVCAGGVCQCVGGFVGNDPTAEGCHLKTCSNDLSCRSHEICLKSPLTSGYNQRICTDACSQVECGPNYVCLAESHRPKCICKSDSVNCQQQAATVSQRVDGCLATENCPNDFLCSPAANGINKCLDPCERTHCGGPHQICIRENGKGICKCGAGTKLSQETGVCESLRVGYCKKDDDCENNDECVVDDGGFGHCRYICDGVLCGYQASCVPSTDNQPGFKKRAQCLCKPGTTGNPNVQCTPIVLDECADEADCSENHACVVYNGRRSCQLACNGIKCGPNAICISNNHIGKCQCMHGKYAGDPWDRQIGCINVSCVSNSDCFHNQTCDLYRHECTNLCRNDICGKHGICIAQHHGYRCICPFGFVSSNSEKHECLKVNDCSGNPCHPTGLCEIQANGQPNCVCPKGFVGDANNGREGCHQDSYYNRSCSAQTDCPKESICRDHRCVDPCFEKCAGKHSKCTVVDRVASCSCAEGFTASARNNQTVCTRLTLGCLVDAECKSSDGICLDGQCKTICRISEDCSYDEVCHFGICMLPCVRDTQCPTGSSCAAGYCVIGCRSNKECKTSEACINHQCSNPCEEDGICGANSLCRPISHHAQCYCPEGFESDNPYDRCYRRITTCATTTDCGAGRVCLDDTCYPSCESRGDCASGEHCVNNICHSLCFADSNCQLGQICRNGICSKGCRSDMDCKSLESCISSKCQCGPGFFNGSKGCLDVNECEDNGSRCHSSAICVNTPGSFTCQCRLGLQSENAQLLPCKVPEGCKADADCHQNFNCIDLGQGSRCVNLCVDNKKCGPKSQCVASNQTVSCYCPQGLEGNPYDLTLGCFSMTCNNDSNCPEDKLCDLDLRQCVNPCDKRICGEVGECTIISHKVHCNCQPGFEWKNGSCGDFDECAHIQSPCHPTAQCANTVGSFNCNCPSGMTGNPYRRSNEGCRELIECRTTSDCPAMTVCDQGACKYSCDGVCGTGAVCKFVDKKPTCSCLSNYTGDPKSICRPMGCTNEEDCFNVETCYDSKCLSPCDIPNICGANANCSVIQHKAFCFCHRDFRGDPVAGCRVLKKCDSINHCPTSYACVASECVKQCSSDIDCLSREICLNNLCATTCKHNTECQSPTPFCHNKICAATIYPNSTGNKCSDNLECTDNTICINGSCRNPCEVKHPLPCPADSECVAINQTALCQCRAEFIPKYSVGGHLFSCSPISTIVPSKCGLGDDCLGQLQANTSLPCTTNNQCQSSQVCAKGKCEELCSANPCGINSKCTSTDHRRECRCENGFVGNPETECVRLLTQCNDYAACRTNQTCVNGVCLQVCLTSLDFCAQNEKCINGSCLLTCKLDSDCFLNQICLTGLCLGGCRSDADCSELESCHEQKCVNPCKLKSCGPGSICHTTSHQRVCKCPPGMRPHQTPQAGCHREHIRCQQNSECPEDLLCIDRQCKQGCGSQSRTCLENEICKQGFCQATCSSDSGCERNEICQNKFCEAGCRQNKDCLGMEICLNNKCTNPCNQKCTGRQCKKPCGVNSDCTMVNQKPVCSCPKPYIGDPYSVNGCRLPIIQCQGNNSCPQGMNCAKGQCSLSCTKDEACESHQCIEGSCHNPCKDDNQCGNSHICLGDSCTPGCRHDTQCPATLVCVHQECKDPCKDGMYNCGACATCEILDHQPVCYCPLGWVGDPGSRCRPPDTRCTEGHCPSGDLCVNGSCTKSCQHNSDCPCAQTCLFGQCRNSCKRDSDCSGAEICENGICSSLCRMDSQCSLSEVCISGKCIDACSTANCGDTSSRCIVSQHLPVCICANGEPEISRRCDDGSCKQDSDCSNAFNVCKDRKCRNPCFQADACGDGASCRVMNRKPFCTCPTGWTGVPEVACTLIQSIEEKTIDGPSLECDLACGVRGTCRFGENNQMMCVCPKEFPFGDPLVECRVLPTATTSFEDCRRKGCNFGMVCQRINTGKFECSCPDGFSGNLTTGCIQQKTPGMGANDFGCRAGCDTTEICLKGKCVNPCTSLQNPCDPDQICSVDNHTITCYTVGSPSPIKKCTINEDCTSKLYCSESGYCLDPCEQMKCGSSSNCMADNHTAKCLCYDGGLEHEGNCIRRFRTDFPRPEMTVNCMADGIQVDLLSGPFGSEIRLNGTDFKGLVYVKGHSKDPQCRKSVEPYLETFDFEVKFGKCGLIHNEGEASFVLVIQKHPRLVTFNAQAYDIKCIYMTGEKTVTLGFNVAMLTTAGTIANTGPPPTCSMRIASATGGEITSAQIGDSLVLRIDVQPSSIYGGFARRCVAKTMEGDGENEYTVTDEDGCASDPSVFGDWEFQPQTQVLEAHFNAFKFPSSSSIKFQCNVRVCFGICAPVDCRGEKAFGRKRRSISDEGAYSSTGGSVVLSEHPPGYIVKEEVQIESNPILAIERREGVLGHPSEAPQIKREEVCVSIAGFVVALVFTSVISLVAMSIAISCWILAYKRKKLNQEALIHPPEFPNPLFITSPSELITEPLPDYLY